MKIVSLAFVRGFIAILLFGISNYALSQYSWNYEFTGDGRLNIGKISVDPFDNIYVVGDYYDGIQILDNKYEGFASYLAKFNPCGEIIWQKIIPSFDEVFGINFVDTDGQGNVYISGHFADSTKIDGFALKGFYWDSFVAKFDSDGNLFWAKALNVQNVFDISVNNSGELFVGSWFSRGDPFPSGQNALGALLSADGEILWTRTLGGTNNDSTFPITTALDDSGNAYFAGIFTKPFSLDNFSLVPSGNFDLFLTKFNRNGNCIMLKGFKRIYNGGWLAEPGALTVDDLGNIYFAGGFWNELSLDQYIFTGTTELIKTYVAKLDSQGNVVWAKETGYFGIIEELKYIEHNLYLSAVNYDTRQVEYSRYSPDSGIIKSNGSIAIPNIYRAHGFAVDSKENLMFSVIPYHLDQTKVFFLKVNRIENPPFSDNSTIQSDGAFCYEHDRIQFYHPELKDVSNYEWEILHQGTFTSIFTTEPTLTFSLQDYSIENDFLIRVKGLEDCYQFSLWKKQIVDKNLSYSLNLTCDSIIVTSGENFQWMLNNEIYETFPENTLTIFPIESGKYLITNSNACGQFNSNEINFNHTIQIPNIITPNDDSLNDFFVVDTALENPSISIYNLWGKQVYQNSSYDNSWAGEGQANGTYYYSIHSKCLSEPIKGWVAVKR